MSFIIPAIRRKWKELNKERLEKLLDLVENMIDSFEVSLYFPWSLMISGILDGILSLH